VIVILLLFAFVKYQEEKKLIEPDRKDAAIAKELLSRVKDLKDVNEPLGILNENGELLDVAYATTIDNNGNVTDVTKYETLKDKYGNDVEVKLKKQIEKTKDGKIIEGWIIDKPYEMLTKYYSGEIKKIEKNSIYFIVQAESKIQKFQEHGHIMENVKDYLKVFDLNQYDLNSDKGPYIPSDNITIGFKSLLNINDLNIFLNKKINIQESTIIIYKNSPESKLLAFTEY
jgi:hypothetical protein